MRLGREICNERPETDKPLKGKIGFYYENMIDGDKLSYNADHVFTAASVIKVPLSCMWRISEQGN
ncbi:MAG: serine hydrolase [Anaerovoracaceae bacterium]